MASVLPRALGTAVVTARATEASSVERLRAAHADLERVSDGLRTSERRVAEILGSRSYRASRVLSRALRLVRRRS